MTSNRRLQEKHIFAVAVKALNTALHSAHGEALSTVVVLNIFSDCQGTEFSHTANAMVRKAP